MSCPSEYSLTVLFILLLVILIWLKINSNKCKRNKLPPSFFEALHFMEYLIIILKLNYDVWLTLKELMQRLLRNKNSICTFKFAHHNIHFLKHPDDSYVVANKCLKKHALYVCIKGFFGEGLITANVPTWKAHRKLLTPFMNQQALNGFIPIFNQQAKQLVNALTEKAGQGSFDHFIYVREITINTVCATILGYENNEKIQQLQDKYIRYFKLTAKSFVERVKRVWTLNDFLFKWSSLKKQQDEFVTNLRQLRDKIIDETESEMKLNTNVNNKFKTFLQLALELKSANLLTAEEVKEEADTMIAAAYDTTSISIGQTMVVLGSYPDVQERAYREVQEFFDGSERDFTIEDLSNIKYLDAVVKETLRLYPVVPVIFREIEEDLNICDYTLPAGDGVCIPIYALNRHSVWGPDAEEFRPERWLNPSCIPEKAFATFGVGRRTCIGMQYAILSMKIALVNVLHRFKITADISKVFYDYEITLNPVSGHFISLEER